jgi:2',3'-cyclic-nucleotide 2'-phosphodiesterase (5'-nucleotidase family)
LPEDMNLAKAVKDIDIILGGHDHFTHHENVDGVTLVKSGL